MRNKADIIKDFREFRRPDGDDVSDIHRRLLLEVLLDIREIFTTKYDLISSAAGAVLIQRDKDMRDVWANSMPKKGKRGKLAR